MCNAAVNYRINKMGLYIRPNIGCFVINFRSVVNFIYVGFLV